MTNVNLNQLPQRGSALMGALADKTRKSIFNLLMAKPLIVKVIAADLPISQSAVSQHLKVMKEAGLVLEKKQGRSNLYSANPLALDWLSWQFGLLRDDVLNESEQGDTESSNVSEFDSVDTAMEQWSLQWPNLDTLSNGVMLRFCLIGRHLEWLFERLAADFGLSGAQVLTLSTLDRLPDQQCSLFDLASASFTQASVTEAHIQSLQEKGLVEQQDNAESTGTVFVKMTSHGRKVLHEILETQKTREHAPIYQMQPEQQLKLAKMLRPLLHDLREVMKEGL